jgi:hypothetical protein
MRGRCQSRKQSSDGRGLPLHRLFRVRSSLCDVKVVVLWPLRGYTAGPKRGVLSYLAMLQPYTPGRPRCCNRHIIRLQSEGVAFLFDFLPCSYVGEEPSLSMYLRLKRRLQDTDEEAATPH